MARQITDREKLMLVSAAMGQNVTNAQATTLNVFDTNTNPGGDNIVTFFEGCNTRALPATNLNTNKLPYKNNLVIDYVYFDPGVGSFGEEDAQNIFGKSYFSLTIGSQDVLRNIPLNDCCVYGSSEPFESTNYAFVFVPKTKLVIPADTTFKVTLFSTGWFQGQSAEIPIRCALKGYGTIKGGTTY